MQHTQPRHVLPLTAPVPEARWHEIESGNWGEQVSRGTDRPDADVVGTWVTADGRIRQELRADGRYDEARGGRLSAYTGRYTVTGNHLDYVDDTGFTATGDIRDGVLYHEHLVLHRESADAEPSPPTAATRPARRFRHQEGDEA